MEFSFCVNGYAPDTRHSDSTAVGTFAHDRGNGYDLQFPDIASFKAWLSQEQRAKGIEYLRKEIVHPPRHELPARYLRKARTGRSSRSTMGVVVA
ncbi:hypothetical protein BD626DRAFT_506246 [Schizophyllum amplum]|uniref:Uncharacterized protein n=1 Tax=Schizophyllum amplum TaxID=97359 RepID=A0A550C5G3_9AGAR|nr:hypothetical protein BD626DRAFT_506246 [Auriculariopsis ampla]